MILDKISDSGLSSLGCIDITILKEKIIRIEWFQWEDGHLRNINKVCFLILNKN
jgi:hypothetical protein